MMCRFHNIAPKVNWNLHEKREEDIEVESWANIILRNDSIREN